MVRENWLFLFAWSVPYKWGFCKILSLSDLIYLPFHANGLKYECSKLPRVPNYPVLPYHHYILVLGGISIYRVKYDIIAPFLYIVHVGRLSRYRYTVNIAYIAYILTMILILYSGNWPLRSVINDHLIRQLMPTANKEPNIHNCHVYCQY